MSAGTSADRNDRATVNNRVLSEAEQRVVLDQLSPLRVRCLAAARSVPDLVGLQPAGDGRPSVRHSAHFATAGQECQDNALAELNVGDAVADLFYDAGCLMADREAWERDGDASR